MKFRERGSLLVYYILLNLGCFSDMIASLEKLESDQNYNHFLIKASAKLGKAYTEADIRLLLDGLLQKNTEHMYITTVFLISYVGYSDI